MFRRLRGLREMVAVRYSLLFLLHSPEYASFFAPPVPLMVFCALMGVGGVVRLVFPLSVSLIRDDFP